VRFPTKISPCPIIESIVEIRFKTKLIPDAVFGVLYNAFKEDYPGLIKLPILQLPAPVRDSDPNLIFQPHYRLSCKDFLLQIGPRVISLSNISA
jgi:uncharacterized protein (TIGR04255 family)